MQISPLLHLFWKKMKIYNFVTFKHKNNETQQDTRYESNLVAPDKF